MAEKKGQKFGRNRDRSPSAKRYKMVRKDKVNKVAKVKRHVKKHPNDQRAASALTALSKGSIMDEQKGPAATYPRINKKSSTHKPDGLQDLDMDFRKCEFRRIQGKKVVVPLEVASSNPIFEVVSNGVTKDRGLSSDDVARSYIKSHAECSMVVREGDKVRLLYKKAATPPVGFDNQFKRAYAG